MLSISDRSLKQTAADNWENLNSMELLYSKIHFYIYSFKSSTNSDFDLNKETYSTTGKY